MAVRTIAWRKSSRSGDETNHAQCVELARLGGAVVGIRDSKNPEAGNLSVASDDLAVLVGRIKAGHFAL